MSSTDRDSTQYSNFTGLLYVFNLIVGTGALTLPHAFSKAGWLLSVVILAVIACFSFITMTFVVESMATLNAILKLKSSNRDSERNQRSSQDDFNIEETENITEDCESSPLCHPSLNVESSNDEKYEITNKLEMGEMAFHLFSPFGQLMFLICICIYLFGDLAIYSAAVSESLVDVVCTSGDPNASVSDLSPCFDGRFTKKDAYHLFLVIYLLLFGPFVFSNVQKTKYLQMMTYTTRIAAFALMIGIAIGRISTPSIEHGHPIKSNVNGLPVLFGSGVYAFMCHHSLPSLLAPIANKKSVMRLLLTDVALIFLFYSALSISGVFAFPKLEKLYSWNFAPSSSAFHASSLWQYFVILFPVFTISTSFPIIAITLRNNLRAMLLPPVGYYFTRNVTIPLLTAIAPVCVAALSSNLEILVRITGSYAGAGIQYVIPACLVLASRNATPASLRNCRNSFASPFASSIWPLLVLMWAAVCLIYVTSNIVLQLFEG